MSMTSHRMKAADMPSARESDISASLNGVPLLSMRHVTKVFDGVTTLKDGQLEVGAGEIHGLIGANGAGKSTLMNILYGIYTPSSGTITYQGKEVRFRSISDANDAGVFMVHQDLNVVKGLTVAQNIFLGREPMKGLTVDDNAMLTESKRLLDTVGLSVDPAEKMGALSPAEQQLVQIGAMLSRNMKLLILDEPTTALGDEDVRVLFSLMRKFKAQGISMIFISHRLDELLEISDRITVMRDGQFVTCSETAKITREQLVYSMTGREVTLRPKARSGVDGDAPTVLEVNDLSTAAYLHDISFVLRKGEILGLTGLMGSGRTEVAKAVCGIDPTSAGTVLLNGRPVRIRTPMDAAALGIGYLSENRDEEGLIRGKNVIFNTALSSFERYGHALRLDDDRIAADAEGFNRRLGTKCRSYARMVERLSGGNRQKVVIARALMKDLQILIFDEPTRGIDVGAKRDIYDIIESLARDGHSMLVISSDTEEIRALCDRVLVMYEGTIAGELQAGSITTEGIMALATGTKEAMQ